MMSILRLQVRRTCECLLMVTRVTRALASFDCVVFEVPTQPDLDSRDSATER